jgi:hypothetical protein
MAIITYTNQMSYNGRGYLDAKMQPVATKSDLDKIPRSQRFIGLTVTVLDDGSGRPYDYWLESSLSTWTKKTMPEDDNNTLPLSGNDME